MEKSEGYDLRNSAWGPAQLIFSCKWNAFFAENSQPAMMLIGGCINVDAMPWRYIDVDATVSQHCVPVGLTSIRDLF